MSCKKTNRSSTLRYRLTLQQQVKTPDGMGGFAKSWADIADVWAEIKPAGGTEKFFGAQLQSSVTHRITIRYRDDVSPGQRLLFDKRIFNIRYVHADNDNRQTLEIWGEEGVAT